MASVRAPSPTPAPLGDFFEESAQAPPCGAGARRLDAKNALMRLQEPKKKGPKDQDDDSRQGRDRYESSSTTADSIESSVSPSAKPRWADLSDDESDSGLVFGTTPVGDDAALRSVVKDNAEDRRISQASVPGRKQGRAPRRRQRRGGKDATPRHADCSGSGDSTPATPGAADLPHPQSGGSARREAHLPVGSVEHSPWSSAETAIVQRHAETHTAQACPFCLTPTEPTYLFCPFCGASLMTYAKTFVAMQS
mmetsp:Transcript_87634/g.246150  ORF Transcript_87634/g.246150 Transcript_87634/m.246150 type:complete len:252 (+) Transcript_87634:85-840(+)